nr:hypothetical protein [Streptosporangium sp. 'caverna']
MQLYERNGTGAQRWTFDSGTGRIVNPQFGRCLDATGVSFANGTRPQQPGATIGALVRGGVAAQLGSAGAQAIADRPRCMRGLGLQKDGAGAQGPRVLIGADDVGAPGHAVIQLRTVMVACAPTQRPLRPVHDSRPAESSCSGEISAFDAIWLTASRSMTCW